MLFYPGYELQRTVQAVREADRTNWSTIGTALLALCLYLGILVVVSREVAFLATDSLMSTKAAQSAMEELRAIADGDSLSRSWRRQARQWSTLLDRRPELVVGVVTFLILMFPLTPVFSLPCRWARWRTCDVDKPWTRAILARDEVDG